MRFQTKNLKISMLKPANTFMQASHLYWALWSLIQAKMSLRLSRLGYLFLRYNEYKKRKKEGADLARSYFAQSGAN
uniref:Uncharacterized protein n=1 Tax=Kalanchoe fedtschenkoi TaxID=63787 RepID=A0A7N0ZW10_KALFE